MTDTPPPKRSINVEDAYFNGQLIEELKQKYGRQKFDKFFFDLLARISDNATGVGATGINYSFNRGCDGWKGDRTMRLGLELQKLLMKLARDGPKGIAPHITIDIPADDKKEKYERYYSGPDLAINEEKQDVTITGIAHLYDEQFEQLGDEATKVYCDVMSLDRKKVLLNKASYLHSIGHHKVADAIEKDLKEEYDDNRDR